MHFPYPDQVAEALSLPDSSSSNAPDMMVTPLLVSWSPVTRSTKYTHSRWRSMFSGTPVKFPVLACLLWESGTQNLQRPKSWKQETLILSNGFLRWMVRWASSSLTLLVLRPTYPTCWGYSNHMPLRPYLITTVSPIFLLSTKNHTPASII